MYIASDSDSRGSALCVYMYAYTLLLFAILINYFSLVEYFPNI
jgi:hypothetical protein